jgi:hypothetical protein
MRLRVKIRSPVSDLAGIGDIGKGIGIMPAAVKN